MAIISKSSIATCGYAGGANYQTFPYNFGNVVVQRDTPVGTILATQGSGPIFGGSTVFGCMDTPYTYATMLGMFTSPSGIANVYNTNIPGVGIKITNSSGTNSYPYTIAEGSNTYMNYPNGGPVINLIKTSTGAVGAGAITIGPVAYVGFLGTPMEEFDMGNSNIIPVACSINTPNILVPLDNVLASDLTAVGTTAKPQVFNVGLDCDAGARVNAQLTGTSNTDTDAPGVLQLSNAGGANVATGVGIQILYNNAPVVLNQNVVLKTSNGGQESFPFTAQYYQTKTAVTSGSANATATLILTYQ